MFSRAELVEIGKVEGRDESKDSDSASDDAIASRNVSTGARRTSFS